MSPLFIAIHFLVVAALPILFVGVINRTKAIWAGRRGPRLWQVAFDLLRLLRKRPVYSQTTTGVFQIAPWVMLATTLVSAAVVPVLGRAAPASFPYDFVFVAYLWGVGRIGMMLAALDTGSAFEGMGASREATYAALLEPGFFITLGTLAAASGSDSFARMLDVGTGIPAAAITAACVVALVVVLQVESARLPVDDPNTHLELTMIHEVMVLDHSGPELAAIQYGAAMKMTLCAALVATLLNPVSWARPGLAAAVNVALTLAVGVGVGLVESLMARFRMRVLPHYVSVSLIAGLVALLTTAWRQGGVG